MYVCPRCDCEGEKAPRRRLCTECLKDDIAEYNRRYNILHNRVDPDRARGRPSKEAARQLQQEQQAIMAVRGYIPTTTGLRLRWV